MFATTSKSVVEGPMLRETSNARNRPRTLLRPRWRMANVIAECLGSMGHWPGVSVGDEATVRVVECILCSQFSLITWLPIATNLIIRHYEELWKTALHPHL